MDPKEFALIRGKLERNLPVTSSEVRRYLYALQDQGAEAEKEISRLMMINNASSIDELSVKLAKQPSNNWAEGLITIGLGALLAWAIMKLLDKD
ncbi:hypothetical protein GCM10011318_06260 [Phaeocystidibacter marisrubri]|nr:hypothetical protein GCM10011318_06260 [Phaeocystidibacter marisrubri]